MTNEAAVAEGRHRIYLNAFDAERYPDAWVEIHDRRTYGMRLEVQEAAATGIRVYRETMAALYIVAWSFDGAPDAAKLLTGPDGTPDEFMPEWLLGQADEHYTSQAPDEASGKGSGAE